MALYSTGQQTHSTAIHSFEVQSLQSGALTNEHAGWEILFGGTSEAAGCEFIVQGRQFDLTKIRGLIFNGRDDHQESFREKDIRASALVIDEDFVRSLLGPTTDPKDFVFLEPQLTSDRFDCFARSIHNQLRTGDLSTSEVDSMTSHLVFEILDSRLHNRKTKLDLHRSCDDVLTRLLVKDIVEALHLNISNCEFDLDRLSEELGVTKFHAIRVLKRVIGMTPAAYLARLRLRLAKHQLDGNTNPVAKVAFDCGFADMSTFNKAFKRSFGHAPTAYRNR